MDKQHVVNKEQRHVWRECTKQIQKEEKPPQDTEKGNTSHPPVHMSVQTPHTFHFHFRTGYFHWTHLRTSISESKHQSSEHDSSFPPSTETYITGTHTTSVKGKGKVVRMHARKARGTYSVGTATRTIKVGTTGMRVFSFTFRPLYSK